jgi:hypothetical protein
MWEMIYNFVTAEPTAIWVGVLALLAAVIAAARKLIDDLMKQEDGNDGTN